MTGLSIMFLLITLTGFFSAGRKLAQVEERENRVKEREAQLSAWDAQLKATRRGLLDFREHLAERDAALTKREVIVDERVELSRHFALDVTGALAHLVKNRDGDVTVYLTDPTNKETTE